MMIPIQFYSAAYFSLLTIILLFSTIPLLTYRENQEIAASVENAKSYLLITFLILFIGLRDPWGNWRYLGDTSNYSLIFNDISAGNSVSIKDFGFNYFVLFSSKILNLQGFYILCSILYVVPVYITFKKWFKQRAFYAMAVYVSSMSFWAFGINGLRNGLAASIFIYGIGFMKKKEIVALLIFISISFHKSMILPGLAFLIGTFIKDTKFLVKAWLACIIISFFFGSYLQNSIEQSLGVFGLQDDRASMLYSDELDGQTLARGFRIDFIFYSGIAVWLGYYFIYIKKHSDEVYIRIFNTFLIANTVWVLLIYAAYTNRTAYLSWFLMPIVLVYPLLKFRLFKNQYQKIAIMILGSLMFTIIMFLK